MTWITVTIGERSFSARLLTGRAPAAVKRLRESLPLAVRLAQDNWSGSVLCSTEPALAAEPSDLDTAAPFQYPGLIAVEPGSGRLALCYGQGRLQDGAGPRPPVPLAEVVADLDALARACAAAQFDGAVEVRLTDGAVPAVPEVPPNGTRIALELGTAVATAVLLEDTSPQLTRAFAALLPMDGRATTTHSSGPLTRFWNGSGGPEGETPLEYPAEEERHAQAVLYPGHIYYQPKPPWRGLRIAVRDATVMRNAVAGGALRLLPLARFEGDWGDFAEQARLLSTEGARPLRLRTI